ncbi:MULTISPECIES: amino acid ABC transporter permease [unclassified Streptomyces]|uniref:amino acid ABC transporter permease n=1 Tax=unclassified Streptomyces TaxID=2593676 RepID=UPI0006B196D5|nr:MULTISPECIES: amino acid ABC transporter permease [unclassified Streptomyces]KOY54483.1 amino acid ABC transporter permease [Streptomyces sp. XY332]TDU75601.1 glutamate transport system permease protein [Streptomyces sp. KS 21]THA31708.1 amino acid ABC transporter permease [Streptomyces sp. A1547]
MSSVLYDTPGPKARARNWIYTAAFLVVFGLAAWWVLAIMAENHQLDADKWSPFLTDGEIWTTFLLPGLGETLKAGLIAMVIALPLGAILGMGRLSDHRWVRIPVGAWVEFFRAIPVLMLMLFGSALYVRFSAVSSELRPLYAVVTGLVLYNSAVIAEIVVAGIRSLPQGQTDAAKAIGMRKGQIMVDVLIPQAVTAMLPALVSQLVVILKDTAIGGAVLGLGELLSMNRQISANYSNTIATLVVIALLYIVVNFMLTTLASWIEGRLRKSKKGTGAVVAGDVAEVDAGGAAGVGEAP